MPHIDTSTELCAVIGNPVAHSLSPLIHNTAFEALGLNYAYLAFQIEDVPAFMTGLRAMPSFRGVSVTIPHKRAVRDHLDEIDATAQRIGSVNTILHEGGKLFGRSTDGPGTLRAFREAGVDLTGKRILFLGSGGAVRAVAFAMALEAKPESVTILGRTSENVRKLAKELREGSEIPIREGDLSSEIEKSIATNDVVVQGTPIGMYPASVGESCVPKRAFETRHVVFDMVYRPRRTRLIEEAEAAGCVTVLGLEMLLYQAVLQFEWWTGEAAPEAAMRAALEHALESE